MKHILLLFFTFNLICAQSQLTDKEYINSRRGQLFFKGEIEYRLTPIYEITNGQFSNWRGKLAKGEQNSGTGLNYSLNYFITKNFSVNFGQSFRYDIIFYPVDFPDKFSTNESAKSLLIDYHFSLDYYLKIFSKGQLYFRLGFSMNNTNSEYVVSRKIEQTGVWIIGPYFTNYDANNFALGYKIKKTDIAIGVYQTNYTEYEPEPIQTLFPYIKISYDIFKL